MISINATLKIKGFRPLELLQAFLNAWVVQDPEKMEQMLDIVSKERMVRTDILELNSGEEGERKDALGSSYPGFTLARFIQSGRATCPARFFTRCIPRTLFH